MRVPVVEQCTESDQSEDKQRGHESQQEEDLHLGHSVDHLPVALISHNHGIIDPSVMLA